LPGRRKKTYAANKEAAAYAVWAKNVRTLFATKFWSILNASLDKPMKG